MMKYKTPFSDAAFLKSWENQRQSKSRYILRFGIINGLIQTILLFGIFFVLEIGEKPGLLSFLILPGIMIIAHMLAAVAIFHYQEKKYLKIATERNNLPNLESEYN